MGWFDKMLVGGLALTALASCRFDTSTATEARVYDADLLKPDAIDPADCPEDIFVKLSINGVTSAPGAGQPFVHALLGDTIELSAVGTCTQSGTITYDWSISPSEEIAATARPGLSTEVITVYPSVAGDYFVTLSVGDGSGQPPKQAMTLAFTASGFEDLPYVPGAQISDLHAGTELWIGASDGAFYANLDDPTDGPDAGNYNLANNYGAVGDEIPTKVRAVFEHGQYAWFGPDINDGKVYRLDFTNPDQGVVALSTISNAKNRDIAGSANGLFVATDQGIAFSADFSGFVAGRVESMEAVHVGSASWGGGDKLYPLSLATEIDAFGTGDNKIRSIRDDGLTLWLASDGSGVARKPALGDFEIFTPENSDLSTDKVRAMSIDSQGDIWVATQAGVNRYKQDRQIWVPFRGTELAGVDFKAITVDEANQRRAIYVGGKDGLAVMRIP